MSKIAEFLNRENETHQSLISFYKLLPEFNPLDIHDRVLLVKSNLTKLVHLHCMLIFNFQEYPNIGEHMMRWVGEDFHQSMTRTRTYFLRFMKNPLILKLILVVFIFTMNLAVSYDPDSSNDYSNKTTINEIQQYYTTILWRYLNTVFDEKEAIRSMGTIVTQILHLQTLMVDLENAIWRQTVRDEISELEISLFRLKW
jgi:hypothetical protein